MKILSSACAASIACGAAAAALLATPAAAQTSGLVGGYGDLGVFAAHAQNVTFGAVMGRVGLRIPYVGVEGEAGVGLLKDSSSDADLDVPHEISGYAVGFLPIGRGGDLFARVGYGTTSIGGSFRGHRFSAHGDSVNYGVGGQAFFRGGANGIRADYTHFDYQDHLGSGDMVSLTYVRRFRR